MDNFRKVIIPVVILIGVLVAVFSISPEDVVDFNDAMVDAAVAVDKAFAPIQEVINPYYEGEVVDFGKAEAARKKLLGVLTAQEAEIENTSVPDDDLCREFKAAVKAYVSNSRAIVDVYAKIIAYIKEHNPGTEEDGLAIDALFGDLLAKDEALFEKVGAVQKRMTAKHDITLE